MPLYSLNLWNYLKNDGNGYTVDMSDRFHLMQKILSGLIYFQNHGYKHFDIKLSNILIKTTNSGKWDGTNCVITDFGIGGKTEKAIGMAGTPGFASPEQLIGIADGKSDNYSIGRVMVFLFSTWQGAWDISHQPIQAKTLEEWLHSKTTAVFPHCVR